LSPVWGRVWGREERKLRLVHHESVTGAGKDSYRADADFATFFMNIPLHPNHGHRHGTPHFAAGILLTYEPVLLMLPPVKNPYDVKHAMANARLKGVDHEVRQSG